MSGCLFSRYVCVTFVCKMVTTQAAHRTESWIGWCVHKVHKAKLESVLQHCRCYSLVNKGQGVVCYLQAVRLKCPRSVLSLRTYRFFSDFLVQNCQPFGLLLGEQSGYKASNPAERPTEQLVSNFSYCHEKIKSKSGASDNNTFA